MESKITPNPMTPDKTLGEILKSKMSNSADLNRIKPLLTNILEAMQEYADQEKRKAFNEALELAAEKVKLTKGIDKCGHCNRSLKSIDKQSILNLKIK